MIVDKRNTNSSCKAEEHRTKGISAPLWRQPRYMSWFTADTASAAGTAMQGFAISLVAFKLSGSVVSAGWLTTLMRVVQQFANLFGGTFVDRHGRKQLIIINCAAEAALWGTVFILLFRGNLTFWVFAMLAVCSSLCNGFLGGATDAVLRSIIDIRDYPKARSVSEGRDATINLVGSPLGGALYGFTPWLPFLMAVILYALAGVSAHRINFKIHDQQIAGKRPARTSFFDDFKTGWRYVFSSGLIVVLLIMTALLNLGINGVQYAIQLYLVSIHTNAFFIGLIDSSTCIGVLVGAFMAGKLSDGAPVGISILASSVITLAVCIPMMFNGSYVLVLVCSALIGLPFPLYNAMCLGFIFAKTPNRLQGRVKSAMSVSVQTLSIFSSAIAGMLLGHFGFTAAIMAFGVPLTAATIVAFASQRIRKIPAAAEWERTGL
ncbi:MFS transporter [Bifidobacterium aquikefiri]|uniref:MFS transporter n=1 Tax=Bifidobacterium aquikefiri TaxID=1653207 RepID=UPI0039E75DDA